MRKSLMLLLLSATASLTATAALAADPTPDQIYAAAESGHLAQAQQMVQQVLKDHPDSAKAHYVAAEIDAKAGQLGAAREEFQRAERIDPGLDKVAKAGSVAELRAQLFPSQATAVPATRTVIVPAEAAMPASRFHFPWFTVFGFGLVIWVIWLLVRRRYVVTPMGGPVYGGPRGPMDGGYGYGGPVGYGGYPPGGGIGSGIAGGLASGLAVGAGVVAGEELAHRLLDGGESRTVERIEPVPYQDPGAGQNGDMGGNDFGLNDSSSWDDSSGGGDFGGGDNSW